MVLTINQAIVERRVPTDAANKKPLGFIPWETHLREPGLNQLVSQRRKVGFRLLGIVEVGG